VSEPTANRQPTVLAIDTATEACSAALMIADEIAERYEIAPRRHAELILPMIDTLLAEAGIGLDRVDVLGFGCGPGAFTGVRIAAGVAQGIAFGAELPVVPVSTLAALAQGALRTGSQTDVLAAIDARMHEVYWGAYQVDEAGLMRLHGAECVSPPAEVPLPPEGKWFGVGTGWDAYGDALRARLDKRVAGSDERCWPRARDVALLAAAGYRAGVAVTADAALPVYLRDRVVAQPPA